MNEYKILISIQANSFEEATENLFHEIEWYVEIPIKKE